MRIAVLIDELAPGSAPKVVGQTVKGLTKLGHKCDTYVLIDNGKMDKTFNFHLSGVKIKYLFGKRPWWDLRFPGFDFFSLHHILGFFAGLFLPKYDMVIANTITSVPIALGMKLRGSPYIFYIHCNPCIKSLEWLAIKLANGSIVSGYLHRYRFAKILDKNLYILRLGCVPAKRFVPYSKREDAVLIFDRWDKGTVPKIPKIAFYKVYIGGFNCPKSINAEYIGKLNEADIIRWCSKVKLHIHFNQEAFGMSTLEAAACGCCISIPEGSGVADLFPKWNGVSEEIGKLNWKIAKKYTWENYSKNLEEIIKCAI